MYFFLVLWLVVRTASAANNIIAPNEVCSMEIATYSCITDDNVLEWSYGGTRVAAFYGDESTNITTLVDGIKFRVTLIIQILTRSASNLSFTATPAIDGKILRCSGGSSISSKVIDVITDDLSWTSSFEYLSTSSFLSDERFVQLRWNRSANVTQYTLSCPNKECQNVTLNGSVDRALLPISSMNEVIVMLTTIYRCNTTTAQVIVPRVGTPTSSTPPPAPSQGATVVVGLSVFLVITLIIIVVLIVLFIAYFLYVNKRKTTAESASIHLNEEPATETKVSDSKVV